MNQEATKWVKWTRSFNVTTKSLDSYRIFISEHEDGAFYASCLYYERGRALRAPEQPGGLDFKLETIVGNSSDEVFQKIQTWAMKEFGADIKIKETT